MSNIVIPDGGNIGSASDTDAISIPANGKPTFSAGIANTGTIDAGTFNGTIGDSATFPKGSSTYITKKEISGAENFTLIHGTDGFVFDSSYDEYIIYLTNLQNTSAKHIYVQVGTSAGIKTSSYIRFTRRYLYNGGITGDTVTGTADLAYSNYEIPANASATRGYAIIRLRHMSSASFYTLGLSDFMGFSGLIGRSRAWGQYQVQEANDRVHIAPNGSGGAFTCTVTEVGVKYV